MNIQNFCENRVIQILKDLVNLESENPPGNEAQCADYILDFFSKLGVSTEKQEVHKDRYNVIATMGSGSPVLLYNGHIDVVPIGRLEDWTMPPYQCTEKDGKLYGRGTCDMKGSIACMLHAAECLKNSETPLNGTLIMTFVVDEEKSNTGTKHLLESGISADACIVGEPSELDINLGHRGVVAFCISIKGKSCHAAKPTLGINPIYKAMKLIKEIQLLDDSLQSHQDPYLGTPLISVTMFTSAIKVNVVPNEAEICIDRRMLPFETKEKCEKEITDIINKLKKEDPQFDAEWKTTTYCPPGMIDENHCIVKKLQEAGANVLSTPPVLKGFGATCEASFFSEKGIPTVIYGPGSLDQAHNMDEYIDKNHLLPCAKIYAQTILEFLK